MATSKKTPTTPRISTKRSTKASRRTVAPRVIWAPRTTTPDAIAHRAYQLWERRGRIHGHHREDWLTAETELMTGIIFPPR